VTGPTTINIVTINHQGDAAQLLRRMQDIMATQNELAATLNALTGQVTKIGGETRTLLNKIGELTDALAAAGQTTPEVDAALAALVAQVGVVDALVPDAE
jgi:uncharacterized protein YoxC